MLLMFTGCNKTKTLLDKNNPVTLSLWHVYGEQSNSPFNKLIEEFNHTVGLDKGIIINVTNVTDAVKVGDELIKSFNHMPDSLSIPDIFFCHKNNAKNIGIENLINFKDHFTQTELSDFLPDFLSDGIIDEKLVIFPVSKSTHLLFINGSRFNKFSLDTGVSLESLKTWEGYFAASRKYYEWSGGLPFSAIDYPIRDIELQTMKYDSSFKTNNDWYDFNNLNFKNTFKYFMQNVIKGNVVISDKFFNTQIMTGEVASGIGSSAAILYCNDTVTYPDNTKEKTNLIVLPLPKTPNFKNYVTQAGVGLCAHKTTKQKEEAIILFTKWLTEAKRNLEFVSEMGYMPVRRGAFDEIKNFKFYDKGYENLYKALLETKETSIFVRENEDKDYFIKVQKFYAKLKANQKAYNERYKNGEDIEILLKECFDLLKSVG